MQFLVHNKVLWYLKYSFATLKLEISLYVFLYTCINANIQELPWSCNVSIYEII